MKVGFEGNASVKRVLVVGANSYIGDSFARCAQGRLSVDTVDSYEEWKTAAFEEYDSVLMVAGLAHRQWTRKQRKANKDLYFAVNCDLAVAVAAKAKASGVGQFIYLSSMAVYGLTEGEITADTVPTPKKNDYYGLSKYQAEEALVSLFGSEVCEPSFKNVGLCVIRPPMVYGPGCPGNFFKLVGMVRRMPVFPNVANHRSMIYIENLCAFIVYLVENSCAGVYLPQNKEYVNTTALAQLIGKITGQKLRITKVFNPLLFFLMRFMLPLKKIFGNLTYVHDELEEVYDVVGFEESVRKTFLGEEAVS